MKPSYLNCTLDRFQWSRGVSRLRWVLHGLLALLCSFFAASPAWADHLVIKRHVTLRETPSRVSQVVTYRKRCSQATAIHGMSSPTLFAG